MRKIILSVAALIMLFALSCGGDTGTPQYSQTYPHGHSGPNDGGTLNSPSFLRYNNGDQLVTSGSTTIAKITAASGSSGLGEYDSAGWYVDGVYGYKPQSTGKYYFMGSICGYCDTTTTAIRAAFYKNGALTGLAYTDIQTSGLTPGAVQCLPVFQVFSMNGTSDYVSLAGRVTGTGACHFSFTVFEGFRISN